MRCRDRRSRVGGAIRGGARTSPRLRRRRRRPGPARSWSTSRAPWPSRGPRVLAGSRLADAIAAAGGYASDVDLAATAAGVNLAQPLTDGQQVVIPRLGEAVAGAAPSQAHGAEGAPAGGLVNLNTATPEELEDLPGIGAVTVQKIVAAREERPFTSLEDAVERGVIHRGQLEDLQGIATAG